jgi:ABC-type multidrug transport system ATPase subunit
VNKSEPIALQTVGLTKRYDDKDVVQDLSLEIHKGDIYGFLGPNGAGKTTSIRMILGLIRRDAGTVRIFGSDKPTECRSQLSGIVESPALYPYLTGRDNLRVLGAYSGGVPDKEIDEALETVRLTQRADELVKTYSLGMKQRLGIAQSLMTRPKIMVLDEPTNGLDPAGMREVRELVRELNQRYQLTVFVSSHLLAEVSQLCNRVGIIQNGKLVAQGPVAELLKPDGALEVRLEVNDTDAVGKLIEGLDWVQSAGQSPTGEMLLRLSEDRPAELNRLLVEAGVSVKALIPQRMTLEDFFIQVTSSTGEQIQ